MAPADASGDPGPEKFRPEELKCIAAALSDLPAPTGTSTEMPLSTAQYMTHTRGLVIEHLMRKMYEKGDLELETRVQGALDETSFRLGFYTTLEKVPHPLTRRPFDYHTPEILHSSYYKTIKRHNMYFILETLYTAEQEIRNLPANNGLTTDQIDFSILNSFHVESSGFTPDTPPDTGASNSATIDWTVWGNSADADLTEAYMDQILTGLNGGNPEDGAAGDQATIDLAAAVKARYQEIFDRTSELTDCANKDKASF